MKTNLFFMAALGFLAYGCSNDSELTTADNAAGQKLAPVTVQVHGFFVSQEDFSDGTTRAAQDAEAYDGVKVLTLAFYNGAAEAYKVTQTKGALEEGDNFGVFSLELPMGSYTMVVIGQGLSNGEPPITLNSPVSASYGDNTARDTFVTTQTVNVTNTDAVDVSATLNRVIAKLQVASSDTRTANVRSVRMTLHAGGKSFSPTTGLATVNTGFSNTIGISSAVGATSLSNTYLFLSTDEQTMDVTIETLDEDGNTLFSKLVENVPFKRNRVTVLTGAMYSNTNMSGTFQVETAWLANYSMGF